MHVRSPPASPLARTYDPIFEAITRSIGASPQPDATDRQPAHNGGSRVTFAIAPGDLRLCRRPVGVRRPGGGILAVLSGCPSNVGGDDVCGMPVQGGPGAVIAHGRARVSM
jgi:hypothetical protein